MDKQVDLTDFDDCMVVGADLDFLHNQKKEKTAIQQQFPGRILKKPRWCQTAPDATLVNLELDTEDKICTNHQNWTCGDWTYIVWSDECQEKYYIIIQQRMTHAGLELYFFFFSNVI